MERTTERMQIEMDVVVENEPGTLARLTAAFSRRRVNIEALRVEPTGDRSLAHVWLRFIGDEILRDRLTRQLERYVDVVHVASRGARPAGARGGERVANIYYSKDADPKRILSRTVAILGYGSQGHAQAQNLRDNGVRVIIGVRAGRSAQAARADGFEVHDVADAVRGADVVHMLLPDETQRDVFQREVRPNLKSGAALGFSHGFNIHYGQVVPPDDVDVFMVAPKAPGHEFRRLVAQGQGVPGLLAVHQDRSGQAHALALAFAWGIGCTPAGVIETTFREETESDLFGEQAVLCGGVSELVKAGFETLVAAGYQPEIAYFECMNELKLIVDLMYQGGLTWMRHSVSDTAEYGDMTRGSRVIDGHVREAMRSILREIQDGTFAREWILENAAGRPVYRARRREERDQELERVGHRLRSMMPWLENRRPPDMGDDTPRVDGDGRAPAPGYAPAAGGGD